MHDFESCVCCKKIWCWSNMEACLKCDLGICYNCLNGFEDTFSKDENGELLECFYCTDKMKFRRATDDQLLEYLLDKSGKSRDNVEKEYIEGTTCIIL